ncbi:RNA polymerase sigma factor [Agromyces sp. Marseille-P2726]|uniref:RNA polymerase sigma factor n=1 Tax=Agromyces sp. Marseille-P2726 TaxID=2709132 RepID=UPI00156EE3D7|nr:sigma-70 family RNA polymerase sigma factor [Agromyces sp. Marseille-P2726]
MSTVGSDEAALWRRSVAGEGIAFGALFDLHRDRVFRHSFWLLGDVHEAEDASASAFMELWRCRGQVRLVAGSVLPWLLVTTSNVCRNLRRARRRYHALLDSLPRSEPALSAEDTAVERLAIFDAVSPELADALKDVSERDLGLVSLTILEGFSIAEAAAALGMSPSAAKTRLYRLRTGLRQKLAAPVNALDRQLEG